MFRKLILIINVLLALLLLGIVATSFNYGGTFSFFSIMQLVTPYIIGVHILFLVYWLIKDRKWSLVSLITLIVAFGIFGPFYRLTQNATAKGQLSLMSYNVMGFNKYGWIAIPEAGDKIISFIKKEDPDILCLQEYRRKYWEALSHYPHRTETSLDAGRSAQAIFTKFPIVGNGTLNPPGSRNNIIYADIVYELDTIRIYNVHLESFKMNPLDMEISENSSSQVVRRMQSTFKAQLQQAKLLKQHIDSCAFEIMVCGDFNNTQFSNVYRMLSDEMNDSYLSVGSGLGTTYLLKGLPIRIDYILASGGFEIMEHKNFDVKFSDHYPVMATLNRRLKR